MTPHRTGDDARSGVTRLLTAIKLTTNLVTRLHSPTLDARVGPQSAATTTRHSARCALSPARYGASHRRPGRRPITKTLRTRRDDACMGMALPNAAGSVRGRLERQDAAAAARPPRKPCGRCGPSTARRAHPSPLPALARRCRRSSACARPSPPWRASAAH